MRSWPPTAAKPAGQREHVPPESCLAERVLRARETDRDQARDAGDFTFATRMVMSSRRLSWEKLATRLWTILVVSAAERPASPAS